VFTEAKESVSMVTVSAAAVEAPVCIDTVGVRAASAVVRFAFVNIYAIHYHQERRQRT